MTDSENEKRKRITPPERGGTKDKARSIISLAIQQIPMVGPSIDGLADKFIPTEEEKSREAWESEISERTNEHSDEFDRYESMSPTKETLTGLAANLIVVMLQECPDGMAGKEYQLDNLCVLFPKEEPSSVEAAVMDLKVLGLIDSRDWIGGSAFMLNDDAYEQLDYQIMGWNTREDAIVVAQLMLSEETGHAPDLHEKTGWDRRRFNPAFQLLLPLFPDGRIRGVMQPDYPKMGVVLIAEDLAALRRWIGKEEGV